MAFNYTYDLDTAVGLVRLAVGDNFSGTDQTLIGNRTTWPCVLADEEIAAGLTRRNNAILETAADLLIYLASNRALLSKMISVGDYKLDTRHLADQLKGQAQLLMQQAEQIPAELIIELYGTQFQAERMIIRDLLANTPGWQDVNLP